MLMVRVHAHTVAANVCRMFAAVYIVAAGKHRINVRGVFIWAVAVFCLRGFYGASCRYQIKRIKDHFSDFHFRWLAKM